MKIKINVDEIEFEYVGKGGGVSGVIGFTFHNQMRIKKAFERELTILLLETKPDDRDSFIGGMLTNHDIFFKSNSSTNINFVKEIDGEEFIFPAEGDQDPSMVGKGLAKSIYSSLNLMDSKERTSNTIKSTNTRRNKKY
ncbi:MAG: hypothetical protein ACRD6U_04285 [Nitrososphaeraceae archaeon]